MPVSHMPQSDPFWWASLAWDPGCSLQNQAAGHFEMKNRPLLGPMGNISFYDSIAWGMESSHARFRVRKVGFLLATGHQHSGGFGGGGRTKNAGCFRLVSLIHKNGVRHSEKRQLGCGAFQGRFLCSRCSIEAKGPPEIRVWVPLSKTTIMVAASNAARLRGPESTRPRVAEPGVPHLSSRSSRFERLE